MKGRGKILLVIMDGVGDRAVKELGHRTPLEVAHHPNLDWFARQSSCGIMDTIAPGIRPGSDTAHLALLGFDPYKVYSGRGPFEAAGVGLIGKKGDVAFRCNFATVNGSMNILDRRAGRIGEPDTGELASGLDNMEISGVHVAVREATEHRAVLMLSGEGLSHRVTDVDPHELGRIHESHPQVPEAELTAKVINQFVRKSYDYLKEHPINRRRREQGKPEANILLPRGAGVFSNMESFQDRYGLSATCISGVSLIRGIGRILGMDVREDKEFTGGLDTNMMAKARAALEELERKDFVLLNVKAPDIASHDGKHELKVQIIESLDAMVGYLRENLTQEMVLAFAADHCTPVELGDHSGDPVPVMVFSDSVVTDEVGTFDERAVIGGGLGRIRGIDLMPILLSAANRAEKFGA